MARTMTRISATAAGDPRGRLYVAVCGPIAAAGGDDGLPAEEIVQTVMNVLGDVLSEAFHEDGQDTAALAAAAQAAATVFLRRVHNPAPPWRVAEPKGNA